MHGQDGYRSAQKRSGRRSLVQYRFGLSSLLTALSLSLFLLLFASPVAQAQEEDPANSDNCLMCHDGAVIEGEAPVMEAHRHSMIVRVAVDGSSLCNDAVKSWIRSDPVRMADAATSSSLALSGELRTHSASVCE